MLCCVDSFTSFYFPKKLKALFILFAARALGIIRD